jgi:hypothetical protein
VEVENYFSTVNIENLRSLILFQSILQILPLTFNRHIGNSPTGTVGKKSTSHIIKMTFTLRAVVKSNGREIGFRGLFYTRIAYGCIKINFTHSIFNTE